MQTLSWPPAQGWLLIVSGAAAKTSTQASWFELALERTYAARASRTFLPTAPFLSQALNLIYYLVEVLGECEQKFSLP